MLARGGATGRSSPRPRTSAASVDHRFRTDCPFPFPSHHERQDVPTALAIIIAQSPGGTWVAARLPIRGERVASRGGASRPLARGSRRTWLSRQCAHPPSVVGDILRDANGSPDVRRNQASSPWLLQHSCPGTTGAVLGAVAWRGSRGVGCWTAGAVTGYWCDFPWLFRDVSSVLERPLGKNGPQIAVVNLAE